MLLMLLIGWEQQLGFGRIKARDRRTCKVIEFRPRRLAKLRRRLSGLTPPRLPRFRFGPMLVLALAALAVGLQFYPTIHADSLTGPVTHVRDGDTIEVAGRPIRLQGLNCAELGTSLGSAGRAAVSRLVAGQTLTCELTGELTYDREVGRCLLPNGDDIAAVLIQQGVCGRCARYDRSGRYADRPSRPSGPPVFRII